MDGKCVNSFMTENDEMSVCERAQCVSFGFYICFQPLSPKTCLGMVLDREKLTLGKMVSMLQ